MSTEDEIRVVVGRWRTSVKGKARRIITVEERAEMRLQAIRERLYQYKVPLEGWQVRRCYYRGVGQYEFIDDWHPFNLGDHWGGDDVSAFFRLDTTVPQEFAGRAVYLRFYIGGDSLLTLNGVPHHGIDPFRSDIFLLPEAKGGEPLEMRIESYVNMHGGESDVKKLHVSELCALDQQVWDAYWDIWCIFKALASANLDERLRAFLSDHVWTALKMVPLQEPDIEVFRAKLAEARAYLRREVYESDRFKGEGLMHLVGHSHLDIVYLWPYREFVRKVGRTHSTMLRLMEQYPEFRFSQSQAKIYADMKQYYPEVFAQVKQRVAEKRWEPIGAFWCEPDCNLISGESFVRQILYGQKFWQREFGLRSRTCWQPDVFGLSWAMPQILKRSGIEYIFTNKMFVWNDTNPWKDNCFWWEGMDGSRVLGVVPPSHFIGMNDPDHMDNHWRDLSCKTTIGETVYCYGWGDGGGGVDPEMLESARRYRDFPGLVPTTYSFVEEALDSMKAKALQHEMPLWRDELYLEAHRGTFTNKATLKKLNRRAEFLLREAEMANALAWADGADYPQDKLDETWTLLLTNQFHDALPGTHVHSAYEDMLRDMQQILAWGDELRDGGVSRVLGKWWQRSTTRATAASTAMVVVNTLLHDRQDLLALPADALGDRQVFGDDGQPVPFQRVTGLDGTERVLLQLPALPGVSVRAFTLDADPPVEEAPSPVRATATTLENEYLKATFAPDGTIVSLWDKEVERELMAPGARGNAFRIFEDIPGKHDAWDIIAGYVEHEIDITGGELTVDEQGPLRASLRLKKQVLGSTLEQRISLATGSRQLVFETAIDWKERQKLLKVDYPLALNTRTATYDIAYGNIERPTTSNNSYDAAKFEVPAHLWADQSEGGYGVSLINDGKYGYGVKGSTLELTLLKGSIWPDATADLEQHYFTYTLYCHPGDWRQANTMQRALELNVPPVVAFAEGPAACTHQFLACDAPNVTLEALKRSEDGKALLVRLVERQNIHTKAMLTFDRPVTAAWSCNLMEETEAPLTPAGNALALTLKPYEIVTLRVEL